MSMPLTRSYLHRVDHAHKHFPLLAGESAVQIALDKRLRSPQAHREGEHLGVADGGARIGERARVLVDAKGEYGGLKAGYLHLALFQEMEHGGGLRAVGRKHPVLAASTKGRTDRILRLMVVEDDCLDVRAAAKLRLRSPMRSGSAVSTMTSCRILFWSISRRLMMGRVSPCSDTNSRTLGLREPARTILPPG